MVNVDLKNGQDDLYALLVVPILGVIGGFCAYIIRRYRDRILYRMLFRFLGCIVGGEDTDSSMTQTETTSADTTIAKRRFTDPDTSQGISSIYPDNSTFISTHIWDDRIQTDAKKS